MSDIIEIRVQFYKENILFHIMKDTCHICHNESVDKAVRARSRSSYLEHGSILQA